MRKPMRYHLRTDDGRTATFDMITDAIEWCGRYCVKFAFLHDQEEDTRYEIEPKKYATVIHCQDARSWIDLLAENGG